MEERISPLLWILYVVLETVLTIVISCLIFFTIPHFTYPSFLSIFFGDMGINWQYVSHSFDRVFFKSKTSYFSLKDMERFPVFLFASCIFYASFSHYCLL